MKEEPEASAEATPVEEAEPPETPPHPLAFERLDGMPTFRCHSATAVAFSVDIRPPGSTGSMTKRLRAIPGSVGVCDYIGVDFEKRVVVLTMKTQRTLSGEDRRVIPLEAVSELEW